MSARTRLACVVACAGLAGAAGVASGAGGGDLTPHEHAPPAIDGHSPDGVAHRLPGAALVDDAGALELANKLGLSTPRDPSLRGLPSCPPILQDAGNCHTASLTLGASFSGAAPGAFRVMDNVIPLAGSPTRLCWIGRYANRVDPPVADEMFRVSVYGALPDGLPDLAAGPVFTRDFRQSGTPGNDLLEMSCLDGETCPGTSSPAAGGHWVFSAEVAEGFPMNAGGCYWVEILNVASNAAGVNWGWCGSQGGTDVTSLQAADGNYTTFTRAANDRALCLSGGVDPFLGTCTLPPIPTICENPDANGIPFTSGTTGGRASWPGSDGRGLWTPFQRADGFTFSQASTVTSVCFEGFWLQVNDQGATSGTTPPPDPQFRVAYFSNLGNQGFPGDPLPMAEFAVGDPGVELAWDLDDEARITHPPVSFEANECHWISIGRIQSNPLPGEPPLPIWIWQLTTGAGVPTADNRTATRTVGPAGPTTAWGLTVFRGAAPGCSDAGSNYVFVLDAGPTTAAGCDPMEPACGLTVPPGALPNVEPLCTAGAVNQGCNVTGGAFTTLNCGDTMFGSSSVQFTSPTTCGTTRDNDWYHLTVAEGTEVTVTVTSQFPGFMGYGGLMAGITNPTGSCAEYSGVITNVTPIGICEPSTLTRTLAAGTWIIFVAPNFGDPFVCDGPTSLYTISVSCTGDTVDCNENGTPDGQEIAGNPALDCYNPAVVANPHVIGGADGALDACQCQGNFNRDAGVNSTDISAMLAGWLSAVQNGNANADINCSGSTNSTDISAFLAVWLAQVQNTNPWDGCP